MTREELVRDTRQLIDEGERLVAEPEPRARCRCGSSSRDELLAAAWGSMDRYHLAWLQVGRPSGAVRGRADDRRTRRRPTCARSRPRRRPCCG